MSEEDAILNSSVVYSQEEVVSEFQGILRGGGGGTWGTLVKLVKNRKPADRRVGKLRRARSDRGESRTAAFLKKAAT